MFAAGQRSKMGRFLSSIPSTSAYTSGGVIHVIAFYNCSGRAIVLVKIIPGTAPTP
jgi:hypothetical protein